MGNEEAGTPAKTPKTSTTQEQLPPSSPATPYADWASYQAYYNPAGTPPIPPLGFFHSSSSPQTHPYMWGAQHMIPPYGTPPPPYVTMFPHGGLYPHPSIPPGSHPYSPYAIPTPSGTCETAVAAADATELEGKSTESKNRSPLKKSKGGLGSLTMLTGKVNEKQKASGASANGDLSQSGESGNDGSSEGSDSNSQNGSQQKTSCHQGSLCVDEGQNGATSSAMRRAPSTQTTANQTMAMIPIPPSSVTDPTTNLNIGMDFWGGTGTSSMATIRGKLPIAPTTAATVPSGLLGSRDGIPSELWLQDERELKRQRRKQSNRESARRSRLRKQAECEELAQRVESLKEENSSLRDELEHMREECQKLAAENATLTERLDKHEGQEPRSDDIRGPVDRNRERKVTYGIIEE